MDAAAFFVAHTRLLFMTDDGFAFRKIFISFSFLLMRFLVVQSGEKGLVCIACHRVAIVGGSFPESKHSHKRIVKRIISFQKQYSIYIGICVPGVRVREDASPSLIGDRGAYDGVPPLCRYGFSIGSPGFVLRKHWVILVVLKLVLKPQISRFKKVRSMSTELPTLGVDALYRAHLEEIARRQEREEQTRRRALTISLFEEWEPGGGPAESLRSLRVEAFIREHPGAYVKFADRRSIPCLFGKQYDDFSAEYDVLSRMHELCPEHVAEPRSLDPSHQYYMTEYYPHVDNYQGGEHSLQGLSYFLNRCPEVLDEIKQTMERLHVAGLAHGDISGNILYSLTEEGRIGDWFIIAPVGIDSSDEHFEEACAKDMADLEHLKDLFRKKVSPMGETGHSIGETSSVSEAEDRAEGAAVPAKNVFTDPFFDADVTRLNPRNEQLFLAVKDGLSTAGNGLKTLDTPYAFKSLARERGMSIEQLFVHRIEVLAEMMHVIRKQIDRDPFCDMAAVLVDAIGDLSPDRRGALSDQVLVACVEKAQLYCGRLKSALNFVREMRRYRDVRSDTPHTEVAVVGCSVALLFDEAHRDELVTLVGTKRDNPLHGGVDSRDT